MYSILFERKRDTGFVFVNLSGKPFNTDHLERHLHKLCKQAGLRNIGWHTIRHTFASQLAIRGVPLNAVQALLGHSSVVTTMGYAHLAPSTLRLAIDPLINPLSALSQEFGQPVGNQWSTALDNKTTQLITTPKEYESKAHSESVT
jgi:integrase